MHESIPLLPPSWGFVFVTFQIHWRLENDDFLFETKLTAHYLKLN
jgi:hypothetical protein